MMMSVNTPHNWPHFLKALHWLVEKVYEKDEGNNEANNREDFDNDVS